MISERRLLMIKFSALVFILYICIYFASSHTTNIIRELKQPGRNLAVLHPQTNEVETLLVQKELALKQSIAEKIKYNEEINDDMEEFINLTTTLKPYDQSQIVKDVTKCLDRPVIAKPQQRGDYWVLYNYVPAIRTFECHESITYTTHADYTFMDNLVPLLERWQGPISIALHSPGTDFKNTMDSIAYLRECTSDLVKELVTFHIYFSTGHVPKEVPQYNKIFPEPYNCSHSPPYVNASSEQMYKTQKKLLYPVNVGRNVAREMAQTHFVLASDIELYPNPNLISQFLDMIAQNTSALLGLRPKVYPINLFEVNADKQVPDNKTELKEMIANGTAQSFHKKLCPSCHSIPMSNEWLAANETVGLHVFHVGKRNGKFIHWEPIFIGTHDDPLYDERLTWEGRSDKMTQGYALCALDYDFLILDNAFIVHKPGIKIYKKDPERDAVTAKTNQLIKNIIYPELKVIYGVKEGCTV